MTSHLSNEVRFTIPGNLPDLNTYVNTNRANRYVGAQIKKDANLLVRISARKFLNNLKIEVPVYIEYHWYCKNKMKDKDNVCFAKKFINDGLQDAGVLLQDNWKAIIGFSDHFYLDKNEPRIEVVLRY